MARLEDLQRSVVVMGVVPDGPVTVVDVQWFGTDTVNLAYRNLAGDLSERLLYRTDEPALAVATSAHRWRFDGDGAMLRLVTEAYRIHLAWLFDPMLAVHTSDIEPLPHQITAVYGEMLPRQPLRFLLADDPGAGKTIMAGLLIKELIARGDVERCLVVSPGNLVEQWQDELHDKFHLAFDILTRDKVEAAFSGNWFAETPLAICRLDMLSRNEELQARMAAVDWDLIIVDEAHKMSASYFGQEAKYTKRYHLGRELGKHTRHLLLMTATPHNGKEEDFRLFMALIDPDRFEGRPRASDGPVDASDLMRRMVKEGLVHFDGTPLFPERRAYTVNYDLSAEESALYEAVTAYVRDEFNRADKLEDRTRGTVGFALTVLQRRLASSPEAIYQSLRRRRERLETRIREARDGQRSEQQFTAPWAMLPSVDMDDLDEIPDAEIEELEEKLVDAATAARTVVELEAEVATLRRLEAQALAVRNSGHDRKWEELSSLLQERPEMVDSHGIRRKIVIFTEHRDTLNYLQARISIVLGRPEAVVVIHGGMGRELRRQQQTSFTQDPDVCVLAATDAAGEGINLQRAHLMVNYDLPWNPNRLEQRFGRIHRIGQTEVCHLWNLVAPETREGHVYSRLLEKIEQERLALGGRVFDVLGDLTFDNRPLRDLLLEAILYGDDPETKARLHQVIEQVPAIVQQLLDERALAVDTMTSTDVQSIRLEMERAEARRLQPHFIAAFFGEAFAHLGGSIRERERRRYEVTHVPAAVRHRAHEIAPRMPVIHRYERVTFDKSLQTVDGRPVAEFLGPGHPLMDAVTMMTLDQHRALMKTGAVLVDDQDLTDVARALFYLEHTIDDATVDTHGRPRVASRQVHFVEVGSDGTARDAGFAPHLDYRPLTDDEMPLLADILAAVQDSDRLEAMALEHAAVHLAQRHLSTVQALRQVRVDKAMRDVHARLTAEIAYWDRRVEDLKSKELAGKNVRLTSGTARQRVDDLTERHERRMAELARERQLVSRPPVVVGGALIVPLGLIQKVRGDPIDPRAATFARETRRVEAEAVAAVLSAEHRMGHTPVDVGALKLGWDVESIDGATGRLRLIEVKGRISGADSVTVTRNEIIQAINKPHDWILALVEVPPAPEDADKAMSPPGTAETRSHYATGAGCIVRYVRQPFEREPDWAAASVNYAWAKLVVRGTVVE